MIQPRYIKQYKDWIKKNPLKKYSEKEIKKIDDTIRKEIVDELKILGSHHQREFMLKQKWLEIRKKIKKYDKETLNRVKSNMWIPHARSDFRRIVPEMILVDDKFQLPKQTIFEEESLDTYIHSNNFKEDWDILRIFISTSRHDSVTGRQLKYIVRDKVTKKYLGIICISGTLPNLTVRNNEVFKTNNMFKKQFQKGGTVSRNMANGQTIMSCQPFGSMFNGGKLLSLLCSSNQVQEDWKLKYGDTLVSVDTTSLYGGITKNSQYDGLRPFWTKLGETSGKTPIKPSDKIYNRMKDWLRKRYPETYHYLVLAQNEKGQAAVRETKNTIIRKCYSLLKIKNFVNIESGEIRGVYLSKLYKNTDDFLCGKIKEDKLIPSFNNSIEFLTEFWKFGYDGDTKSYVHPEIQNLFNKDYRLEKSSSAKRRLQSQIKTHNNKTTEKINKLLEEKWDSSNFDNVIKEFNKINVSHRLPIDYDWYVPMADLSWVQVKERYSYLLKSD
jgi:hypothetical protein